MTFRTSQRGKEYLETARTLLGAAQTMTDLAIAGRLKAHADDTTNGELRRLRMLMRPRHWLALLLTPEASGVHNLTGSRIVHSVGPAAARPQSQDFSRLSSIGRVFQ